MDVDSCRKFVQRVHFHKIHSILYYIMQLRNEIFRFPPKCEANVDECVVTNDESSIIVVGKRNKNNC